MWVHQQLMTDGTDCIRGLLLAWFPLAEGNTNLSAIMLSLCVSLAHHYDDVIMGAVVSLITSLRIIYSIVYSDADQRKHQNSASLAFVWGIHRGPVNSPHKWPVTRKMFPFDDVIMMPTYKTADFVLINCVINGLILSEVVVTVKYGTITKYQFDIQQILSSQWWWLLHKRCNCILVFWRIASAVIVHAYRDDNIL